MESMWSDWSVYKTRSSVTELLVEKAAAAEKMSKYFELVLVTLMLLQSSCACDEQVEQLLRRRPSDYFNPWHSFYYRPNALIPGKYLCYHTNLLPTIFVDCVIRFRRFGQWPTALQ